MNFFADKWRGLILCFVVAIPCWWLGKLAPIIGAPVFSILVGMLMAQLHPVSVAQKAGVAFTSKKVLQYAVILLGFGLDISVVLATGKQSLPIIVCTITTSLVVAYFLHKLFKIPGKISTLIGVGSSICGGSAVAATAPVIKADDEEVAQAISVIFFFNVLAALLFPWLGTVLGFSTTSGEAFGIFAGTAVNDTSSVTATAATWDAMFGLGTATLDKAVTVKLTRTLAIIPITMVLGYFISHREQNGNAKVNIKNIFPSFIFYFVLASLITTVALSMGVGAAIFAPLKWLSKFFIVMAMAAVGLNTDIVKLVKTSSRPLALGLGCWLGITMVSLILQHFLGLW